MSDFIDRFKSIPFFTRYWLTLSIAFSILGRFIVNPYYLVLLLDPLKRLQVWRILTSVLYYPITASTCFQYLMNLYFLYNYSKRLEGHNYAGHPADYAFLLIFIWICCVIAGLIAEIHILLTSTVFAVLQIWCQLNRSTIVTFFFGTRIKVIYLPWMLLTFNCIINLSFDKELLGIVVGHLYFFMMFKYPQELGGPSLIKTPAILKRYFPSKRRIRRFGPAPRRHSNENPSNRRGTPGANGGWYNWVRGQTLLSS